jgi:anti-sigma factor RsiW
MNPVDDRDLDRAHALMMAVLDGEGTAADRHELEAALAREPHLQVEWDRLRRVKEVTMTFGIAQPPEEAWDRFQRSVPHRTERGIAWFLIAAGLAVLGAAALWAWIEKWIATDLPWVIKAASGALLLGVALLIVSVLRERWYLHRRDPYSKEVLR